MDWLQYWFMFPVAIVVAMTAMLAGIGGAALFIPIFVIAFPLLGPEYPLTTATAIGAALITQLFGFLSGIAAYYRRRLIDFSGAVPFLAIAVPVAIAGALLLARLKDYDATLTGAYAVLMLILCPVNLVRSKTGAAPSAESGAPLRQLTDRDGRTYTYPKPRLGAIGAGTTGLGAFLTGLLGVGIGEVVMPLLVKRGRVPVAVAAATSVFVVILTIASASFTQVAALVAAGGIDAIPWNLVCYSVPGVIIGGQIGPRLQGRIDQRLMERSMGVLFGLIGLAMGAIVLRAV